MVANERLRLKRSLIRKNEKNYVFLNIKVHLPSRDPETASRRFHK